MGWAERQILRLRIRGGCSIVTDSSRSAKKRGLSNRYVFDGINDRTPGSRGSFWTPDETVESENEAVHFRETQFHLHHQFVRNRKATAGGNRFPGQCCSERWKGAFHRMQEAGPRGSERGCTGLRATLCEPAMVGRYFDEFDHDSQERRAIELSRADRKIARIFSNGKKGHIRH